MLSRFEANGAVHAFFDSRQAIGAALYDRMPYAARVQIGRAHV